MNIYPDIYLRNVKEITIELLKKNNIKGLILDVDNTLIDYDKKMLEGLERWCSDLKDNGIKICILSNTSKLEKVKKVAETLNLEYFYFARKPSKAGFKKAQNLLGLEEKNIGVVGDQVFTDVIGGNRCNMFTILTKPIDKRDFWYTRIKRPLEQIVINKYLSFLKKKEGI